MAARLEHRQPAHQRALEVWRFRNAAVRIRRRARRGGAPISSLSPSCHRIIRAHRRIAARFDAMLAAGLVDEVVSSGERYRLTDDASMRCVGYRQIWDMFRGRAGQRRCASGPSQRPASSPSDSSPGCGSTHRLDTDACHPICRANRRNHSCAHRRVCRLDARLLLWNNRFFARSITLCHERQNALRQALGQPRCSLRKRRHGIAVYRPASGARSDEPAGVRRLEACGTRAVAHEPVVATADHNTPTTHWDLGITDPTAHAQIDALDANMPSTAPRRTFHFATSVRASCTSSVPRRARRFRA